MCRFVICYECLYVRNNWILYDGDYVINSPFHILCLSTKIL